VDGTAFDKSDYKPQNKVSKTFVPGQVSMTLSVEIVDDEYKEEDEAFSVKIGSYTQTTVTSGDNCVLITIKDNDPGEFNDTLKKHNSTPICQNIKLTFNQALYGVKISLIEGFLMECTNMALETVTFHCLEMTVIQKYEILIPIFSSQARYLTCRLLY
jgi:hypothetical protein